jgi:hypothetical protein
MVERDRRAYRTVVPLRDCIVEPRVLSECEVLRRVFEQLDSFAFRCCCGCDSGKSRDWRHAQTRRFNRCQLWNSERDMVDYRSFRSTSGFTRCQKNKNARKLDDFGTPDPQRLSAEGNPESLVRFNIFHAIVQVPHRYTTGIRLSQLSQG